jgi:hypothetical protein
MKSSTKFWLAVGVCSVPLAIFVGLIVHQQNLDATAAAAGEVVCTPTGHAYGIPTSGKLYRLPDQDGRCVAKGSV